MFFQLNYNSLKILTYSVSEPLLGSKKFVSVLSRKKNPFQGKKILFRFPRAGWILFCLYESIFFGRRGINYYFFYPRPSRPLKYFLYLRAAGYKPILKLSQHLENPSGLILKGKGFKLNNKFKFILYQKAFGLEPKPYQLKVRHSSNRVLLSFDILPIRATRSFFIKIHRPVLMNTASRTEKENPGGAFFFRNNPISFRDPGQMIIIFILRAEKGVNIRLKIKKIF